MRKISVIIPIYNAVQYLAHTIECLQAQIYTDFEVLLINDGSTDGSAILCESAAKADARFRYIYQENQGVSAARNNGLAHSKGMYIAFLDADDSIPADYLELLYKALVNSGCAMSVCDVAVIEDGREKVRFTLSPQQLTQCEALNYVLTRKGINSGPCAKLFRKEILDGLEFPPLKAYEDILFVVEAVCRCNSIAVTNQTEYRYIQNMGSTMSACAKMPSKEIITASERLMDFIAARIELDPCCLYTTASHLMQYVLPFVGNAQPKAKMFIVEAKKVYVRHRRDILRCAAFPWKEKMMYLLFTCGWLYHDKKMTRI